MYIAVSVEKLSARASRDGKIMFGYILRKFEQTGFLFMTAFIFIFIFLCIQELAHGSL